ncbi:hypothetical protein Tco_1226323 [Tanacetum coccineum]
MGVGGVTNDEVLRAVQMIGCEALKVPFKYLGIMVGSNMNRLHAWDNVIEKVRARSNFFRGVEEGSRKVSWFSWDSVVASKDVGGLGMSSFLAMNCPFLFKWIWRFKVQPDAMWVSIIKAIHGRSGSLDCGAQVENNKEVSLLDKIQNGILYGFRRSPRGGIEVVQLEEASNLLASIELVEEQDKWVRNLEEDGEFKVASGRRFIDEGLSEMEGAQTR